MSDSMPVRFNQSVNLFRTRRGMILHNQILDTARLLGRSISVLDIGGRADYWQNVGLEGVSRVVLLNKSELEFTGSGHTTGLSHEFFEERIGDACNLHDYADASVDLVHSNSVIEHVGSRANMEAMASEALRVGRSGWVQTPALEFPIEPHFHLPFVHWVSGGLRARALKLSPLSAYRRCSDADRRAVVDSIRLLSKREVAKLFPNCSIYTERFLLPKSYVARWRLRSEAGAAAAPS